jgi:hypothetical protein
MKLATSTPLPLTHEGWGFAIYSSMLYNPNMTIIQQIFTDHFHNIENSGIDIRGTVFENVDKMLNCGNLDYGFAVYACEDCGKIKLVPFRCKSRFCTTCGNLYSIRRSTAMSLKLVNCRHRHCVFTIPEELRPFSGKTENS